MKTIKFHNFALYIKNNEIIVIKLYRAVHLSILSNPKLAKKSHIYPRDILKCIILTFVLTAGVFNAKAQDPVFSQFYSTPLQMNPALTGATLGAKFGLNYRNQWPSLNNAYVSYQVAYDQFFKGLNSGFGLSVMADDAGQGLIKTNSIAGYYAYNLKINKELNIRMGLEAGFIQTKLGWDKFVFYDQLDPIYGPVSPGGTPYPTSEIQPDNLNKTLFDVSAGLVVYSPVFYGGFSLKHMNTPTDSYLNQNTNTFGGLPVRLTIHGGAELPLDGNRRGKHSTFVAPNIAFVKQGRLAQLMLGSYIQHNALIGGIWYRHAFSNPDAIIFNVGLKQGVFKFGYSYDLTLSGLSGRTGGAHEISITVQLEPQKEPPYSDCFEMFR